MFSSLPRRAASAGLFTEPWRLPRGAARAGTPPPRRASRRRANRRRGRADLRLPLLSQHGPTITMTSSPHSDISPTMITVGSCLKIQLASSARQVDPTTSCTPSALRSAPSPDPPGRPLQARARGPVKIEIRTSTPISTSRTQPVQYQPPLAHSSIYNQHGVNRLLHASASARASAPVDDPLEEPDDHVRPKRGIPPRSRGRAQDHLLLAFGSSTAQCPCAFFDLPISSDARALVEQAHQYLVHAINVVPPIVEHSHRTYS